MITNKELNQSVDRLEELKQTIERLKASDADIIAEISNAVVQILAEDIRGRIEFFDASHANDIEIRNRAILEIETFVLSPLQNLSNGNSTGSTNARIVASSIENATEDARHTGDLSGIINRRSAIIRA